MLVVRPLAIGDRHSGLPLSLPPERDTCWPCWPHAVPGSQPAAFLPGVGLASLVSPLRLDEAGTVPVAGQLEGLVFLTIRLDDSRWASRRLTAAHWRNCVGPGAPAPSAENEVDGATDQRRFAWLRWLRLALKGERSSPLGAAGHQVVIRSGPLQAAEQCARSSSSTTPFLTPAPLAAYSQQYTQRARRLQNRS